MQQSNQPPDYWSQATATLIQRDPIMAALIQTYPNSFLKNRGQPFETLIRAIVGQQISVKAADAIWHRLSKQFTIAPQILLNTEQEILRQLGLSLRKAEYIHAISEFFITRDIHAEYFNQRSDDEIIKELSSVRGIGRWSAEMFLIFTLRRPNIFPVDDIGLLRALEKHYTNTRLTPAVARKMFYEKFSPWCSVATWYLWRSLDPVEIQY